MARPFVVVDDEEHRIYITTTIFKAGLERSGFKVVTHTMTHKKCYANFGRAITIFFAAGCSDARNDWL